MENFVTINAQLRLSCNVERSQVITAGDCSPAAVAEAHKQEPVKECAVATISLWNQAANKLDPITTLSVEDEKEMPETGDIAHSINKALECYCPYLVIDSCFIMEAARRVSSMLEDKHKARPYGAVLDNKSFPDNQRQILESLR